MKDKKDYLWIFLHLPKTGGTTFSNHVKKNLKENEILDVSGLRYRQGKGIRKRNKKDIKVILGHASYYGIHKLFPNKTPRYIVFLRDPAERLVSSYNFEMRVKKGENIDFWKWYSLQLKNEMVHFMDMKYRGKEGTKINLPKRMLKNFHKRKTFTKKKITYFFQRILKLYSQVSLFSKNKIKKKYRNAKRLIDKMYYIGFVDNLDKDLKFLFDEMGIPKKWKDKNITKKSKILFKLDKRSRKKIYEDNKYDKKLFDYAKKTEKRRTQ